jgi:methyl-accepting chemotaxis protein
MAGIAEASVEQSAGIQEINQTITVMEQVTQQNAALVEEASAAADQLRRLAENLVTAVSVFKVPQAGRSTVAAISDSTAASSRTRHPEASGEPASHVKIPRGNDGEWEEF